MSSMQKTNKSRYQEFKKNTHKVHSYYPVIVSRIMQYQEYQGPVSNWAQCRQGRAWRISNFYGQHNYWSMDNGGPFSWYKPCRLSNGGIVLVSSYQNTVHSTWDEPSCLFVELALVCGDHSPFLDHFVLLWGRRSQQGRWGSWREWIPGCRLERGEAL